MRLSNVATARTYPTPTTVMDASFPSAFQTYGRTHFGYKATVPVMRPSSAVGRSDAMT